MSNNLVYRNSLGIIPWLLAVNENYLDHKTLLRQLAQLLAWIEGNFYSFVIYYELS
jgi:hypothetical protein